MNSKRPIRKKSPTSAAKSIRARKPRIATNGKAKKTPTTRKPRAKVAARRPKLKIPPILLEGDRAPAPAASGPGQRYALGPTAPDKHFEMPAELPEAYGTKKLLLTARDPHWLYAHWDLTAEQQRKYNSASAHGHLAVRVHKDSLDGEVVTQVEVHPESRHWFIHVGSGGTKYMAGFGYNNRNGKWKQISTSDATLTPPESVSAETHAEFATIPVEIPFAQLTELFKSLIKENVPLARAIEELRAAGYPELPQASVFASRLTPAQERTLAEMINIDRMRRVWIGSLEVTELVRGKLLEELSSISTAQLGQITSQGGSVSSAFGGGAERQRGFWFNVNAELIIYGATERDARVTIGGKQIKLRGDGSFSFQFALPDGKYPLPVVATSADGEETRRANLQFTRRSQYGGGEVGAHPQDEKLKKPTVETVA